jgi:periplasmic protein TonB
MSAAVLKRTTNVLAPNNRAWAPHPARRSSVAGVVALHVAFVSALVWWSSERGLMRVTKQAVVEMRVVFPEVMLPKPEPKPPEPKPAPAAKTTPQPKNAPPPPNLAWALPVERSNLALTAAAEPSPVADPKPAAPAPAAAVAVAAAQSPAAPPVPAPPPPPPPVVLPSSSADYLNNPAPPYPPIAKRLGESGRVVVRALVGADGSVQRVELRTSSGFERLDQIALDTVQRWRFKPSTRGGVAESMWVNVPIDFKLD